MPERETECQRLDRLIAEQERWIASCGGTLTGYVQRYGSADAPDHSGDGGERIYAADLAWLHALKARRWQAAATRDATPTDSLRALRALALALHRLASRGRTTLDGQERSLDDVATLSALCRLADHASRLLTEQEKLSLDDPLVWLDTHARNAQKGHADAQV